MKTIEQMVQQEVSCCLSSLIFTLANGDAHPGTDLSLLCDQALELISPVPDYEEAAREAGWKHVARDPNPLEDETSSMWIHDDFETGAESAEEACEKHGLEPYDWEVYEHWAVSPWLAAKLAAQGEKVNMDFANLNIWARTNTGQQISSDDVIKRIYATMMKA